MPAANSGVAAAEVTVALLSAIPVQAVTPVNVVAVVAAYVQVPLRPSTLNVPPPALKPVVDLTVREPRPRFCGPPSTAVVAGPALVIWQQAPAAGLTGRAVPGR